MSLIVLWPSVTRAADETPVTGTVLLDIQPRAGVPAWIAEAIELNIDSEISGYQRITVVAIDESPHKRCGADRDCQLKAYGKAGVDIVFYARVAQQTLDYELYETWTRALVHQGSFAIGAGTSLIGLKQQTLRSFHPVLKQGGVLDQKQYLVRPTHLGILNNSDTAPSLSRTQRLLLAGLLAGGALFFALPFLFAVRGMRRRRFRRLAGLRTARTAALLICGAAALAGALWRQRAGTGPLLSPLLMAELANFDWVLAGLGGMTGGWLLIDNLRIAFPPFAGLDRVRHSDVSRLIWSWCVSSFFRLLLLAAYYTPLVLLLLFVQREFLLTHYFSIIVMVPLSGLGARFWFTCWVDCLALYLDDHIVDGAAGRENPWHREIHQYFMGYVRRTGQDIEPRLLERIVFLPGSLDGVYSYGGARSHHRIVIGTSLLELAMGGLDDEPQAEAKAEVALPDWTSGVLLPTADNDARTSGGVFSGLRRLFASRPQADAELTIARRKKSSSQRKPLGQAATLLGHVVPAQGDELVPLISDNVADLEVVRELLSEHYAWYAPDPDEEHDDSDPNDRDFLFGALTREIGSIERRDNQLSTLVMATTERAMSGGAVFRKLHSWSSTVTRPFLRHPTIVADSYAALNFARHHLLQHIFHLRTKKSEFFTARADLLRLSRLSARLLDEARFSDAAAARPQFFRAPFRKRLLWLSQFFGQPLQSGHKQRRRRAMTAGAVAAVLLALGFAVKRSIDYHPTYVKRIAEQQQAIDDAARNTDSQTKGQPADGKKRR